LRAIHECTTIAGVGNRESGRSRWRYGLEKSGGGFVDSKRGSGQGREGNLGNAYVSTLPPFLEACQNLSQKAGLQEGPFHLLVFDPAFCVSKPRQRNSGQFAITFDGREIYSLNCATVFANEVGRSEGRTIIRESLCRYDELAL